MSTFVAITDALPTLRAALFTCLAPLCGNRAYWLQAPLGAALPLLVYQVQAPFAAADFLTSGAGGGLWTIKALASTQAAADGLLATVPPALAGISVAGYGARIAFVSAPAIPPLDGVWTAALVYRMELYQ